jgi:hypothetical protein
MMANGSMTNRNGRAHVAFRSGNKFDGFYKDNQKHGPGRLV